MNNQDFKSIMDKEGSVGIGGESITPYPYRLNTDTLEEINIGLDYLNLNFPMNYPEEIDKLNQVLKVLRLVGAFIVNSFILVLVYSLEEVKALLALSCDPVVVSLESQLAFSVSVTNLLFLSWTIIEALWVLGCI